MIAKNRNHDHGAGPGLLNPLAHAQWHLYITAVRSVKEAIDYLVKKHFGPELRSHGFRGSARQFLKKNAQSMSCVGIDTPPGSYQGEGHFYLEVGIYNSGWLECIGEAVLAQPRFYDCNLLGQPQRWRIEPTSSRYGAWEITPDLDLDAFGAEMVSRFQAEALPWFRHYEEPIHGYVDGWYDDYGPTSFRWMVELYGFDRPYEIVKSGLANFLSSEEMRTTPESRVRWSRILKNLEDAEIKFDLDSSTRGLLNDPYAFDPLADVRRAFDSIGAGIGSPSDRHSLLFLLESLAPSELNTHTRARLGALLRDFALRLSKTEPDERAHLLRIRKLILETHPNRA